MKVAIHQVVAAASPGDAITNYALEIRALLRQVGPSDVYARHIAPGVSNEVRKLEDYPRSHSHNVLVYHASIGEPLVHAFLLSRREPVVLVYHNVTPARYFQRWDPTFAELLDLGRSELLELKHRVVLAIADSAFNAVELEAMGYENVRVVPPVIDPRRLTRTLPTVATANHLKFALEAPYVLFVGQLLPHKRPDLLIQAAHIASTYLEEDAYLMLVGHARLLSYQHAIVELVRELNLPRVHIVGTVSTADLVAFYSNARALITASEHEGFCVPLLEAMAFEVPIVARSCGAIPETVAGGGFLLPSDAGASLIAEAIAAVVQDDALHRDLVERGQRRLKCFDPQRARAEFVDALLQAV